MREHFTTVMNLTTSRFGMVAMLIFLAALSRILPHPFNFTPIGAIALFGAARFDKKFYAFFIPASAMLVSDAFIGKPFAPTYICFVFITLFGLLFLKKVNIGRIVIASLFSSISFFLITNFSVWLGSGFYPQTIQGLFACYGAGLAFYQQTLFGNLFFNTVMGDLFYNAVLFGVYAQIQRFAFKPTVA